MKVFTLLIYIKIRGAPNFDNFRGDKSILGVKSVILYIKFISSYKMFRFDLLKHVMKRVCWFVSHCVLKTQHASLIRAFSCVDFYTRVLEWFSKTLIFSLIQSVFKSKCLFLKAHEQASFQYAKRLPNTKMLQVNSNYIIQFF